MADKRFFSPSGAVCDAAVESDFDRAERYDKVFVGALGVYYRDGFRFKYVPYPALERAFIRVQEVNGRLCCGTANFEYYRLVFVSGGQEIADVMSEKEKEMDAALACIHEAAPAIAIGFVGKE